MKSIQLFLLLFLSLNFSTNSFAQETKEDNQPKVKTDTFTVYGNCGMCKRTIEGSLTDVKGVSSAQWDQETDIMTVKYKTKKISLDEIKQKIADTGYDSDTHRAKLEVYNNLHGCCQYERPPPLETN